MKTNKKIFAYIAKASLLSSLLFPEIVFAAQSDATLIENSPTLFFITGALIAGVFHALSIRTALNNNSTLIPYVYRYLAIGTLILSALATLFHIYNFPTVEEFLSDPVRPAFLLICIVVMGLIIYNSHEYGFLLFQICIIGVLIAMSVYYLFFYTYSVKPTTAMFQSMKQIHNTEDISKYYKNNIIVYSSKSDYYSNSPESFHLGYIETMNSNKPDDDTNRLKKFILKNTESSISIFDNTKLNLDRFYIRLAKKHEIEILMEKVQDGLVVLEDTNLSDSLSILRNAIELLNE